MDKVTDRNVFILGAGFSAGAGAPVIRNFLDVSRELFDDPESGLDSEERELFQEVFDFKKRVAQAREKFEIDLDNIEELFGLVEMSQRLHSDDSRTRDATVYLIAKTLQLSIAKQLTKPWIQFRISRLYTHSNLPWFTRVPRQQVGVDQYQWDIYQHFGFLLTGGFDDPRKAGFRSNKVITFNYDLVLDNVLKELKTKVNYGFEKDGTGDGISVLKLHGSTNWGFCPSCKQVMVLEDSTPTPPSKFRSVACSGCGKPGLRVLLVPPSWDKSEYQSVMRPVWEKAMEALQSATRICIIGYSMPESDSFFKYLLTLGLAENHQLYKLIVVDRNRGAEYLETTAQMDDHAREETVEERYRRMLARLFARKRFHFSNDGFELFLQRGANMLLSRAESVGL